MHGSQTMSAASLEPPTYLNSLQNNIRARPIPWDGAVRAGNITDDHLKKIKAVDKVRKEQRRQTIEGDIPGYVSLLAGGSAGKSVLEAAARRSDIVQYILVLAADLINGKNSITTTEYKANAATDYRCPFTFVRLDRSS
jgi:V-type H+-transporting ATPase subunit H